MTVLLSLLILNACNGPNTAARDEQSRAVPSAEDELILRAEQADPRENPRLILEAAMHLLSSGNQGRARRMIDRVYSDAEIVNELPLPLRFDFDRTNIDLTLVAEPNRALSLIEHLRPQNERQNSELERLTGDVLFALGQHSSAASHYMRVRPEHTGNFGPISNRIWYALNQELPYRLPRLARDAGDSISRGWYELATLSATSLTPSQRIDRWLRWSSQHSEHPSTVRPPDIFFERHDQPGTIAVLLPLSGPLSGAASAIRDGFISAHLFASNESEFNASQTIRIYDTASRDIQLVVQQALDEGCDAIVGPLQKDNVNRVQSIQFDIPVVMLNRADSIVTNPPTDVRQFQFAYAIDDDAAAIARLVESSSDDRIVVFLGAAMWTSRALGALSGSMSRPEKTIAQIQQLSELQQFTSEVGTALGTEQSSSRMQQIEQTTGMTLNFVPRRRQDVDAIVAFIDEGEFDTLVAARRFHFADDLPLYIASPTLRDRSSVDDILNLRSTTIPWRLYPSPVREQIIQSVADPSSTLSLYGVGVDSYALVNQWSLLVRGDSIAGSTGVLSVTRTGVVARTPVWGEVRDDEFVPLLQN